MESLSFYLEAGVAIIALIVWLVRLESKNAQNEKDIARLEKEVTELRIKHEGLDSEVMKRLLEIEKLLARIEGRLTPTGGG